MPVARYSACVIASHSWKQPVVAVHGVVPVAAIVPIFPSIVHIPALLRDHCTPTCSITKLVLYAVVFLFVGG